MAWKVKLSVKLQLLSPMPRLAVGALGILAMQMQTLKSHVLISLYHLYAEAHFKEQNLFPLHTQTNQTKKPSPHAFSRGHSTKVRLFKSISRVPFLHPQLVLYFQSRFSWGDTQ